MGTASKIKPTIKIKDKNCEKNTKEYLVNTMLSLVFLALAIKLDYNCFQFLLLINNHFF